MMGAAMRLGIRYAIVAAACTFAGTATADIIQVGEGQQELLKMQDRVSRVAVGNPETAAVNVLGVRDVLLTGLKRGDTSLLIWLQGSSDPIRHSIVVGAGDLPDVLLDAERQPLKTQVQTDIRVAEVSRTAIRSIGFNFLSNSAGSSAGRLSPPGASAGFESNDDGISLLGQNGFQPINDAFNLLFTDGDQDAVTLLSILERRGLMRTLAEPSLMAMSGQTATFLAGGEFPIPVAQGNGDAISVEFKEFGVRLSLTPTVLQNDRIVLKVAPEVSELDFSSGVQVNGISIPGIAVRRTDTTVELGDGETFIISGLVDQDMAANVDKVPWLGDIPILGTFFRSTSFSRNDRELVMVVTPHLVTPLKAGTRVPLPGEQFDDYDPDSADLFFFERGDFDPDGASTGFTR